MCRTCSPSKLTRIEAGQRHTSAETLTELASIYGTTLAWLLRDEADDDGLLLDQDRVRQLMDGHLPGDHALWQEPWVLPIPRRWVQTSAAHVAEIRARLAVRRARSSRTATSDPI